MRNVITLPETWRQKTKKSVLSTTNKRSDCQKYDYLEVIVWAQLYLSGYRCEDIAKDFDVTTSRVRSGLQRHTYATHFSGLARMNRVQQMADLKPIELENYDRY